MAETLGLGPLHPESISPLARVEALLTELPPERTSTAAAQSAHRASAEWEQKYETVATWFEAGGAVEHNAVLGAGRGFAAASERLGARSSLFM